MEAAKIMSLAAILRLRTKTLAAATLRREPATRTCATRFRFAPLAQGSHSLMEPRRDGLFSNGLRGLAQVGIHRIRLRAVVKGGGACGVRRRGRRQTPRQDGQEFAAQQHD